MYSGVFPQKSAPLTSHPKTLMYICICGEEVRRNTLYLQTFHVLSKYHRLRSGLKVYEFRCRTCNHRSPSPWSYNKHARECDPQNVSPLPTVSKLELDYAEGKIPWDDLPEEIKQPNWNNISKPSEPESVARFRCICGLTMNGGIPTYQHVTSLHHRTATGLRVIETTCETCSEKFDSPSRFYSHLYRGACKRLNLPLMPEADRQIEYDYARGDISWEELPETIKDRSWKGRTKQLADCSAVPSGSTMNSLNFNTTKDVPQILQQVTYTDGTIPDYLEHSGDLTTTSSSSPIELFDWKDYNDETLLPKLEDVMLFLPDPEDDIPEECMWLLQTEQPSDCTIAP